MYGEIIIKDTHVMVNENTVGSIFKKNPTWESKDKRFTHSGGHSLALVVWAGKMPSGKLVISDKYMPEDVMNLESLKRRAKLYGCEKEFIESLLYLEGAVNDVPYLADIFSLAVVFCVRRPCNIIGTTTPIELCSYFVELNFNEEFSKKGTTLVQPAAHRHRISPALLGRMSGFDGIKVDGLWTLIGAGSLGSKLALHMARAGCAPAFIIDNREMSPHNFARHALMPLTDKYPDDNVPVCFGGYKATLLSDVVDGLSQKDYAVGLRCY